MPSFVALVTKSIMAVLSEPSFHDGSGSLPIVTLSLVPDEESEAVVELVLVVQEMYIPAKNRNTKVSLYFIKVFFGSAPAKFTLIIQPSKRILW